MAVDIFMKLGDIKGEAQDKEHKDEIEVLAWNWGMTQSGTMHIGSGGGSGKVSVADLFFTKYADKASPAIITACTKGSHIDKAIISVRKASGDNALRYYTITLEGVMISSWRSGGSDGEERFVEHVSLNFKKFHIEYQPQSVTGGKEGGVIESKWNIATSAAE